MSYLAGVRRVGVGLVVCLVVALLLAGAAGAGTRRAPRFSLSTSSAIAGDDVVVRLVRPPNVQGRVLRIYLVRRTDASSVHSRFDARLSFVGFVTDHRDARLLFAVPPLQVGAYELAYWCGGCLARGQAIGIQRAPTLQIDSPESTGCPATTPNRNLPPMAPPWGSNFHGDGELWVLLPADGMLLFPPNPDDTLFDKMLWVGRRSSTSLDVEYRRLDVPSAARAAVTIPGTLSGYNGPSWASRMYFQPGCWFVSGHTNDASLSFVAFVAHQ